MSKQQTAPSIPAARAAIARDVLVRLVDRYEEARRFAATMTMRADDDDDSLPWSALADDEVGDGAILLIRALAAWHHRSDWAWHCFAETVIWPPMGVALGGRIYLARPMEQYADKPTGWRDDKRTPVMELVRLAMSGITDLDGVEMADVYAEADVEAEDDGPNSAVAETPAPSPATPAHGRRGEPRRPLLRATHTLTVPIDGEPALTVELVVLAQSLFDEPTAERADLPELQSAGWSCHGHFGLDVFTRVI